MGTIRLGQAVSRRCRLIKISLAAPAARTDPHSRHQCVLNLVSEPNLSNEDQSFARGTRTVFKDGYGMTHLLIPYRAVQLVGCLLASDKMLINQSVSTHLVYVRCIQIDDVVSPLSQQHQIFGSISLCLGVLR